MKLWLLLGCIFSLLSAELLVSPNPVVQGGTVVVTWTGVKQTCYFRGKLIPLYLVSTNNYQTLLGIAYDTPVGAYTCKVGNKRVLIKVRSGDFPLTTLVVPKQKQQEGATDLEVLSSENMVIGAAFKKQTLQKYWSGKFLRPVAGSVTSVFGAQRRYLTETGREISHWAHKGVDYGIKAGSPVRAVNDGVVILTGDFQVHGRTVMLDHGQGVVSVYNHLKLRRVTKGQRVAKGQLIGLSGNTGLTTGPHLHYGLSIHNVRVNPAQWIYKGIQ